MATKKGASKGASSKKSARGKEASSAARPTSTKTAGQPNLDMKINLTEAATASGQTVDQHPRPISPSLIFAQPLPQLTLDECGAGAFSCQRSSISTTGS